MVIRMNENDNKKPFIERWNEELDREDLRRVWIKGAIACIATAIVAAFVDFLLVKINASFFVGIIIVGAFIGLFINNSFKKYHIKYSFITLLYVFIGMILLNFLRLLLIHGFSNFGEFLSHGDAWFMIFLHPIRAVYMAIKIGEIGNYIFSSIELILYIGSFFIAYLLSKKKNESETEE